MQQVQKRILMPEGSAPATPLAAVANDSTYTGHCPWPMLQVPSRPSFSSRSCRSAQSSPAPAPFTLSLILSLSLPPPRPHPAPKKIAPPLDRLLAFAHYIASFVAFEAGGRGCHLKEFCSGCPGYKSVFGHCVFMAINSHVYAQAPETGSTEELLLKMQEEISELKSWKEAGSLKTCVRRLRLRFRPRKRLQGYPRW